MKAYKEYLPRVRFCGVTKTWEGEVIGLPYVKFQSREIETLEAAFHEAVDHYLARKFLEEQTSAWRELLS